MAEHLTDAKVRFDVGYKWHHDFNTHSTDCTAFKTTHYACLGMKLIIFRPSASAFITLTTYKT